MCAECKTSDEPAKDRNLIDLEREAGRSMSRSSAKFIIMIAFIGLVLAVVHLTPLGEVLSDIERVKQHLAAAGLWAPLLFFFVSAILAMVGFPRLALTFAAGVVFGFGWGFAIAMGSTLLGSYATFCIARRSGAEWASRFLGRYRKVDFILENQSVMTVFLARQLLITNVIMNILLSLTQVRHRDFILGSLLGFVPGTSIAVLTGSSLGTTSAQISFFQFVLAIIIVLLSVATVFRYRRKWMDLNANQRS